MNFYLRSDLLGFSKSESESSKPKTKEGSGDPVSASGGRGSTKGGKYAARVQDGYDHDGSPKYRYFETEEEYEKYLEGKGRSKEAKKLEHKVKQEHKESTDKHTGRVVHQPASKDHSLLSVKKSILFVRI